MSHHSVTNIVGRGDVARVGWVSTTWWGCHRCAGLRCRVGAPVVNGMAQMIKANGIWAEAGFGVGEAEAFGGIIVSFWWGGKGGHGVGY